MLSDDIVIRVNNSIFPIFFPYWPEHVAGGTRRNIFVVDYCYSPTSREPMKLIFIMYPHFNDTVYAYKRRYSLIFPKVCSPISIVVQKSVTICHIFHLGNASFPTDILFLETLHYVYNKQVRYQILHFQYTLVMQVGYDIG